MLKCWWCGRWFKNKQALRAHLKHCGERMPGGEFHSRGPKGMGCKIPLLKVI
jgi:hypothetical protein